MAWHFSTWTKIGNTPTEDSSKHDVFSTRLSGDAHLRGIQIYLNNAFTAGGRSAPIFACIYGLTLAEMPDEIVICKIEGLVPASNQNGSKQIGFIVVVRGSDPTYKHVDNKLNNDGIIDEMYNSKDPKVAKIYHNIVFYPLIEDIRKYYYMMPDLKDDEDAPSSYTAISWMDGCHRQLSITTNKNVLDIKKIEN